KDVQRAARVDADKARSGQGRPIEIPDIDVWPDPVNGAVLLSDMTEALCRYVVVTQAQADVIATWVLFTHVFDCFDVAAKLAITAPTRSCGKSRLMATLARLVRKPFYRSRITAPTFISVIAAQCPTAMLDETHQQLRGNDDADALFAQFCNGSFER